MKPGKGNRSLTKIVFMLFLIVSLGIFFYAQGQDSQEELKYRVAVNVMAVPIFAVDGSGNPVFDITEDELQIFVNDEPVDMLAFKKYEFTHKEEPVAEEKAAVKKPAQDRVIFLILDTMFNTLTGFKRAKVIAENIVSEALPGDSFVVLENNPVGGLKYVEGPERDTKKVIKKLRKLNPPPDKWNPNVFSSRILDNNVTGGGAADPIMETSEWEGHRQLQMSSERQRYQHQIKHFTYVLSQFKYALKTIDRPKVVFLISEGIALGAFRAAVNSERPDPNRGVDVSGSAAAGSGKKGFYSILMKDEPTVFDQNKIYSAFMLKYLVDVVKSINNGGSVLYTINPRRMNDINDPERSGEMSLRYLAAESGGKYFAGAKPEKIIQGIKKTTAAYYEAFFQVIPDMGNNMKIKVECKRKGVHVHSLIHSEKNRPYLRMEAVQKKLFALNVVKGGSWSRMVGKVMQVKYKRFKAKKGGDKNVVTLQIPLPKVMQDKRADIFLIRQDPKTQKTRVDKARSKLRDMATIKYKPMKKKINQYFVIIEPTAPYCIYNQI
jgi:hypothetical protein